MHYSDSMLSNRSPASDASIRGNSIVGVLRSQVSTMVKTYNKFKNKGNKKPSIFHGLLKSANRYLVNITYKGKFTKFKNTYKLAAFLFLISNK